MLVPSEKPAAAPVAGKAEPKLLETPPPDVIVAVVRSRPPVVMENGDVLASVYVGAAVDTEPCTSGPVWPEVVEFWARFKATPVASSSKDPEVPMLAVTVPLTGCVTAEPSTFQAVVLAVFPGCTVHVPLSVAATVPLTGWVVPLESVLRAPAVVRLSGLVLAVT
jgi:hypothetical protein